MLAEVVGSFQLLVGNGEWRGSFRWPANFLDSACEVPCSGADLSLICLLACTVGLMATDLPKAF